MSQSGWKASGLLFENCSCDVICPGHVHFSQGCTQDYCIGYWALRFDSGEIDGVDLAGAKAFIVYSSPKVMIDGNWSQEMILDEADSPERREKLEEIFTGRRGGPWAVLARFVGQRLPTRVAPIVIEDEGLTKRVSVEGLVDSSIEAIKGRVKGSPVTLENMFNQIHASSQVVARGSTTYTSSLLPFKITNTHGLYSTFNWEVAG